MNKILAVLTHVVQPWKVWTAIFVPLTFWIIAPRFGAENDAFRYFGTIIEVLGIFIIALELIENRKNINAPSIRDLIGNWFRGFARIFRRTNIGAMTGGSAATFRPLHATVTQRAKLNSDDSVEEQIQTLARDIDLVHERISAVNSGVREEVDKVRKEFESLANDQDRKRADVAKKLAVLSLGNLSREFLGLSFIVIGVIFATIPDELLLFWEWIFVA